MTDARRAEPVPSPAQVLPGTKTLSIALKADTDFKTIVSYLEKTLVVPEIPGVRGCDPCLSGLDRLVLESTILERTR